MPSVEVIVRENVKKGTASQKGLPLCLSAVAAVFKSQQSSGRGITSPATGAESASAEVIP